MDRTALADIYGAVRCREQDVAPHRQLGQRRLDHHGGGAKSIQPQPRADPDIAFAVFEDGAGVVGGQAVGGAEGLDAAGGGGGGLGAGRVRRGQPEDPVPTVLAPQIAVPIKDGVHGAGERGRRIGRGRAAGAIEGRGTEHPGSARVRQPDAPGAIFGERTVSVGLHAKRHERRGALPADEDRIEGGHPDVAASRRQQADEVPGRHAPVGGDLFPAPVLVADQRQVRPADHGPDGAISGLGQLHDVALGIGHAGVAQDAVAVDRHPAGRIADPDRAIRRHQQLAHPRDVTGLRLRRDELEVDAVKPVQAVAGADPEIAVAPLGQRHDGHRDPVIGGPAGVLVLADREGGIERGRGAGGQQSPSGAEHQDQLRDQPHAPPSQPCDY